MTPIRRWPSRPAVAGPLLLLCAWVVVSPPPPLVAADTLSLPARSRVETAKGSGQWQAVDRTLQWDPKQTAIVICDMWNQHWCEGATRRVAEMAPRMNEVVKEARRRGVFIIHCPSDTMKFYEGKPQRQLALSAPKATPKVPLQNWCSLDPTREAPLPIDDSDGGCDESPQCKGGSPWRRQIDVIEIADGDAITDSAEAYYLMQQRGIENVIVMGVHLNMCVLGRPFSIRQMINQGKNVVLMRDLTDTMYNSRKRPYVPHTVGTQLMIEHVEKYWCPSITSVAFLGGQPFHFAEDRRPKVVLLIGEDEYKTSETLPRFADQELRWRGLDVRIVEPDASDKNRFPGLVDALRDADLLLISVRRRALPPDQLEAVRAYVARGKPVVGIRTASHAFARRGDIPPPGPGQAFWPEFDPEVLGGHYAGHHGNDARPSLAAAPAAASHPILTGVDLGGFRSPGSLYQVSPLAAGTTPLVIGTVEGKPSEPVAWTRQLGPAQARVFYTSLGHPGDFDQPAFRRLLLNGILWALGRPIPPNEQAAAEAAQKYARDWQSLPVPGAWEDTSQGTLAGYDGAAWYRCLVRPPADWAGRQAELFVEQIDNACEVYFDGVKIGATGGFPPAYANGLNQRLSAPIPDANLRPGQWHLVALRIYDHDGRGGFKGRAPALRSGTRVIPLAGEWQFRTGDDPSWARLAPGEQIGRQLFNTVIDWIAYETGSTGARADTVPKPMSPAQSAKAFTVPADLEIELLLSEPQIAQPLQLSFDERGRLWVVEYRQYPAPAGLKLVSHDEFWRAVYDQVPAPPPRHVRGADRITIHEDTDGDGGYDRHTTFVDGLNIATAVARGRGGVWVLNPPYLLFYPDRNNDDVPDGDPEVHLEGFGLEDTHSVVNSLTWGPDGWLYAAQGSTVTGKVRPAGSTNAPVLSQGQQIWRYHPEQRRYEIFAEGGGNAFGVEIDSQGRIFSGHNGGDTRGFHYHQGAYLRKGFEKHGPLANPYAFGYFPHMEGNPVERFTHTFLIYEAAALPAPYRGKLFGIEPLQGRVVLADLTAVASTFRTRDSSHPVTTTDRWFKPVDIKLGPDGAIYIADWYDAQVNHWRNYQGNMDASNGRVYRLKARGAKPGRPIDLASLTSPQLIARLQAPNRWERQVALRLLADRRDASLAPELDRALAGASGQTSLELLWALYLCGGLDDDRAVRLLDHAEPQVRLWTARLLGDRRQLSSPVARKLAALAATEPSVEARTQLAATARRLPPDQALPMLRPLMERDEDPGDPRQPLLIWWGLEAHADASRDALLALFQDRTLWDRPLVREHLLERILRRYAQAGSRRDLLTCAQWLDLSPSPAHSELLIRGFEAAYRGRSLAGLPAPLVQAMARHGVGSTALALRLGRPGAAEKALLLVADPKAPRDERLAYLQILGEVGLPESRNPLLTLAEQETDPALRKAALAALQQFDDPDIGRRVLALYPRLDPASLATAQTLLASRTPWAGELVAAVEAGRLQPAQVPLNIVRKIKLQKNDDLRRRCEKLWGDTGPPPSAEMDQRIQHFTALLRSGQGDPYAGRKTFDAACASCHTLFAEGGQVGPDLTPFKRDDLDTLLLSIVNPSAEIREGYENLLIETRDERSLNGFLVDQDNQVVVLRGLDGRNLTIERKEIATLRAAGMSLMPEGLLEAFTDQQVRDLFAYLRSGQPLVGGR